MLSEAPGATLLAGGTDLMVEINFNHRKPDDVISLRHVPELSAWSIRSCPHSHKLHELLGRLKFEPLVHWEAT